MGNKIFKVLGVACLVISVFIFTVATVSNNTVNVDKYNELLGEVEQLENERDNLSYKVDSIVGEHDVSYDVASEKHTGVNVMHVDIKLNVVDGNDGISVLVKDAEYTLTDNFYSEVEEEVREELKEELKDEVKEELKAEEKEKAEKEAEQEVTFEKSQALKSAESYLSWSSFSKKELRDQLEYEGFSKEAIDYAVEKAYK